jgi:hypothetical protein
MRSRIKISGFGRRDCEWLGGSAIAPKVKTFQTNIVFAFDCIKIAEEPKSEHRNHVSMGRSAVDKIEDAESPWFHPNPRRSTRRR